MIINVDQVDTKLMRKVLIILDAMCLAFPDDVLSLPDHPLHKYISDMYRIAHMGHQHCKGASCKPSGLETLKETVSWLKKANICDVDKHTE